MKYDDNIAREVEKSMGWVKEDGDSPIATANKLGYHVKFLGAPFCDASAWVGPDKVWSISILWEKGIETTILARSFEGVKRLYYQLRKRAMEGKPEKWNKYYNRLWEKRYRKWCCRGSEQCYCQLCRMKSKDKK